MISANAGAVFELTPENFDSFVGGPRPVLVKFFTPWCGHCKHLAPEYEKAAEAFTGSKKVVVAEVNCDANKELCQKNEIRGYPTVKWFPRDSRKSEDYRGQRTSDDLIKFIEEKAGARKSSPKTHVVSLNKDNFDQIVFDKEKSVLVKFYAPWCGHCKKMAPDFEKAAAVFARDPSVVIAEVECDSQGDLCEKQSITGFPTVKWFPKGSAEKTGKEYTKGRSVADFVAFVNENAGLQRTETGLLTDEAGRIKEMDKIAEDFTTTEDKEKLVVDAKKIMETIADDLSKSAKYYVKVMETVLQKGEKFLETEKARITGILNGKSVSEKKIDDFTIRRNILNSFL